MANQKRSLSDDVERILYTKEDLDQMTDRLASEICNFYKDDSDSNLVLVSVLKGSFIFMADLVRKIDLPCQVFFLRASSYGSGTESSGNVLVEELRDTECMKDANVILVEDILDSGRTLLKLSELFRKVGARSVKICTMLDKPERRAVPIQSDFTGFCVENEFLVGYGLDYDEIYRNLPYVGVLKREIYS